VWVVVVMANTPDVRETCGWEAVVGEKVGCSESVGDPCMRDVCSLALACWIGEASFLIETRMRAYIFQESDADQREPHDSHQSVSLEQLVKLGVMYWRIVGESDEDRVQQVQAIAKERDYKNHDLVHLPLLSRRVDSYLTRQVAQL
jgi:hypothetical protein